MPECHSTNTKALELCQQPNTPEGTLVITNQQTSGRGQRGNTWESRPGMNLTFSVILKPVFLLVKDQFLLNVITSLAVHDYLSETCKAPIHIKWPNDILVNEFKICGILIENQLMGDRFTNVVVGIGFNVNQREFSWGSATSLASVTNRTYDLQEVLEGLLSNLEARYVQLRQGHAHILKADYLRHLYRINEIHTFSADHNQFEGKIIGVDEYGRLRISTAGQEKIFGIKEISFVN
ncbi:biotin--[acetyl-CoA-carboxylase] ligase [Chryseolinea sp. H1M3-3]|uniref:biotin--[acetyl-CoA-carboxylase] ligase n=1 Tax=Chryseolinea sp. H1M3-3 TaxID=3034144 RepID=UPI0023EB6000|nr:biotin--[acetyl-CoA-carboxylase] ligase [Chryseolinea sp. H1M3-3]